MKRRFTLKLEKLFILCLIGLLSLPLLPFGVMAAGNDGEIDLSKKGTRIGVGNGTVQELLVMKDSNFA